MSLLLINYEYPPIGGGAANATLHLARAMTALGERAVVLAAGLHDLRGETEEDGVVVHRLRCRRNDACKSNTLEMLDFMRAAVVRGHDVCRRHAVDRAIAFFTIPGGPPALFFRKTRGIPYVVSLRGGDVPGHVPGMARMHLVTTPLRRAVLRGAAAIVAPSESLAGTSRAADPFPVRIVPSGVDADQFFPAASPPRGPFRFLFVGRLHAEKNLDFLFHRLAAVASSHAFALHVVGDGAERQALERLARELGIADRLHWHGWTEKASLPDQYRQAHCLVLPSQYEGLSNTALEAMASGLPVLASAVPGNAGLVRDGETGLLRSLEDAAAWEQGLRDVMSHPDRAHAMGLAGRRLVQADYSWTAAARAYLRLLTPEAQS